MNSSKPGRVIFGDAIGDFLVRPDEHGPDATTHESDPGPHVRVHDEPIEVAAVQRRPMPRLADRLRRLEITLSRFDCLGIHAREQCVGHRPRFVGGGHAIT